MTTRLQRLVREIKTHEVRVKAIQKEIPAARWYGKGIAMVAICVVVLTVLGFLIGPVREAVSIFLGGLPPGAWIDAFGALSTFVTAVVAIVIATDSNALSRRSAKLSELESERQWLAAARSRLFSEYQRLTELEERRLREGREIFAQDRSQVASMVQALSRIEVQLEALEPVDHEGSEGVQPTRASAENSRFMRVMNCGDLPVYDLWLANYNLVSHPDSAQKAARMHPPGSCDLRVLRPGQSERIPIPYTCVEPALIFTDPSGWVWRLGEVTRPERIDPPTPSDVDLARKEREIRGACSEMLTEEVIDVLLAVDDGVS